MTSASPWRRHFLALLPDRPAVAALAAIEVPSGFRPVPSQDLHATVAFLDTLDERGEARAIEAMRTAAQIQNPHALRVHLTQVEAWSSAWVACADRDAAPDELASWAASLGDLLEARGLGRERRAFRAHVTLARARMRDAAPLTLRLSQPIAWRPAELVLLASRSGGDSGGRRYHPRHAESLGPVPS